MARVAVQSMKWFNDQAKHFQVLTYPMFVDKCSSPNRVFDSNDCFNLNLEGQEKMMRISTRPLLVMELSRECEAFLIMNFDLRTHMYIIPNGFGYMHRRINPVWLVYVGDQPTEDLFAKLIISSDATFLVAREHGSVTQLEDIYHLENPFSYNWLKKKIMYVPYSTVYGPNPVVSPWGTWDVSHGLNATTVSLLKRRSDLKGARIRFATHHKPPVTLAVKEEERWKPKGFMYDVWDSMTKQYNFTSEFMKYNPKSMIIIDVSNGATQVGLVDQLSHVLPTISYSGLLYFTRLEGLLRGVSVPVYRWDLYLNPFSFLLWLAFLVLLLLLSLTLLVIKSLGRRYNFVTIEEADNYTTVRRVLNLMNAYFQQGNDVVPSSYSSRIVYLYMYLVAVVFMIAYTSDIIAVLSQHKRELPFRDLEGLRNERSYNIGANSILHNHLLKRGNAYSTYLEEDVVKYDLDHLVRCNRLSHVCNESLLCIIERNEIQHYANVLPCDVTSIPVCTENVAKSILFSYQLLHEDLLKQITMKMLEGGLIDKLLSDVNSNEMTFPKNVEMTGIPMEEPVHIPEEQESMDELPSAAVKMERPHVTEKFEAVFVVSAVKVEPKEEIAIEEPIIEMDEGSDDDLNSLDNDQLDARTCSHTKVSSKSSVLPKEKAWVSNMCKFDFPDMKSLDTKERGKENKTSLQCSMEEHTLLSEEHMFNTFINSSNLQSHETDFRVIKQILKPYHCEKCEKCFTYRSSLRKHSITHSGLKPEECEKCGKCFTHRSTLLSHLRTHSGEKPHKCEQCGKCFTDRWTFKNSHW